MASWPDKATQGFESSLSSLSLADVLQLQGQNRFSGSIVVSHGALEGVIFLQNGEVVHAEAGALKGEDAVCAILSWPTGKLIAHANVSTFGRTIDKRLDHLLLDAFRQIDESKKTTGGLSPPLDRAPLAPTRAVPVDIEKVRAVPNVTYAVLLQRDGLAIGDSSATAESLAAKSIYLVSTIVSTLGETLGLGDLRQVAVCSQGEQLLLFHSRGFYLAVSVSRGSPLPETEAAVRRALSANAAGR